MVETYDKRNKDLENMLNWGGSTSSSNNSSNLDKEDYVETDGDITFKNLLYSLDVILPLSTFGLIYTKSADIKGALVGAGLTLFATVPSTICIYNAYKMSKNSKK